MQTGENEQALRKIIDFTRFVSIGILVLHFYISCYPAFQQWGLTRPVLTKVLLPVSRIAIFKNFLYSKSAVVIALMVSLLGSKGKKDAKIRIKVIVTYALTGCVLYSFSGIFVQTVYPVPAKAILYMTITSAGYLFMLSGLSGFFRMLKLKFSDDIFNKDNESFPQEERYLDNEYSVNLPAVYHFRGKVRKSWINIINPFRGTLIGGSPGSGKSYFVIRHIITQHIQKGFSMLIYDFKYDDLTKIAYNALLKYAHLYRIKPKLYVINLEQVMHRANPL